jgi:hypothetical protein
MTVVPLEVVAWRLYALPVIAWAVALFGIDRLRARDVRRHASPDAVIAAGSEWRWRQLTRWIDALGDVLSISEHQRRERARSVAARIAAHAGPSYALDSGATWIGAAMAIRN